MRGIARLDDRTTGICYCHTSPIQVGGKIVTGSDDVLTNGRKTARVGDTVLADCGHTGIIVTGKDDQFANDMKVARLDDEFEGCYIGHIIEASEDTF